MIRGMVQLFDVNAKRCWGLEGVHAPIVRHNSTDNRGFDFDFLFLRRPRRTTTTRDRRKEGFKEGEIRLQDLRIRIQLHHANANTVTSLYIVPPP